MLAIYSYQIKKIKDTFKNEKRTGYVEVRIFNALPIHIRNLNSSQIKNKIKKNYF